MAKELAKEIFDRKLTGLTIDQRHEVHRERRLQRRELVKLIQDDFWIGVALDLNFQLDRFFKITQVLDP